MDTKKVLQQQVMMAVRDQSIASVIFRNTIARKLGLNITESECLSYLGMKGTATPTELAHYTGLTTGSTTAMLDRLEKADYLRRKPNPNDRRGVIVETTEKWQKQAQPLVTGAVKAHADLIAEYSDDELKAIADFLARFSQNVHNQTKHIENL